MTKADILTIRRTLPGPHLLAFILLVISFAGTPVHVLANSAVTCVSLAVAHSPGKDSYAFTATSSGNANAITGYVFDFGDQQSYTVDPSTAGSKNHLVATVTHIYRDNGTYRPSVQIRIGTGSTTSTVSSPTCQVSITTDLPISSLPSAGAGNTIRVFVVAALAGMSLSQFRLRRRRHA